MSAMKNLAPDEQALLRCLVAAMKAGHPVYYVSSDEPEYKNSFGFNPESPINPWIITGHAGNMWQWKSRIPQLQEARMTKIGDGVVWTRIDT